jgi:hypothetical protein
MIGMLENMQEQFLASNGTGHYIHKVSMALVSALIIN